MINSMVSGLGHEAIHRVSTEEEFWAAIHSACDLIIYLKKSGLNIVLPEDGTSSRRRFEALVNFIVTGHGVTDDRPAWLTDDLVRRGAETVGSRIDSMQQHLFEPPVLASMRAMVNRCP